MVFYPLSFILLLTPLVFVHELGHFLFAKLFGVRVDVFSIGFGPKFFKKTKGETEYCLSLIPLGGYVKLYGQDPNEEVTDEHRHRSFMSLTPWKRFLILLGGPLFNFLFAILVFGVMLMAGEPHVTTKIGRVVPGSQAAVAGFQSGDVITAVGDQIVTKFEEVSTVISASANQDLTFRVKREGAVRSLHVVPQPTAGISIYGEPIEVGEIDGLYSNGRYTVIGVSNPGSNAGKAGLVTGDVIGTLEGKEVKSFEELVEKTNQLIGAGAKEFHLGIETHVLTDWTHDSNPERQIQSPARVTKNITLPASSLETLGMHSSELFIAALLPGSPAQKGGLQPGDRVVAINDQPIPSFFDMKTGIQKSGEKKGSVKITLERQGAKIEKEMIPTLSESKDPVGQVIRSFAVGIYPVLISTESETFVERIFNPITLTVTSWSRALDLSLKTLISIKKIFSRQVSVGTLGGPLLIGKLAGDSLSRGFVQFLRIMSLISISLAIFNILPIPVLDGGHIFLLGIEVLRGKPLGTRQAEVIQQVGLSLIMLLLVVVLFNDFSRVAIPALHSVIH